MLVAFIDLVQRLEGQGSFSKELQTGYKVAQAFSPGTVSNPIVRDHAMDVARRPRAEREKGLLQSERHNTRERPVAKPFHTTISKDWTDREALEGQRLVALQEKSELNNPLDSRSALGEANLAKFKQSFL